MCSQALPAIRIGRRAAQIRRRLEEGKLMDYEPMLPKDLLKVASKLSKEEAAKVIDEELSKPRGGHLVTTPPMTFPSSPGAIFWASGVGIRSTSGTLTTNTNINTGW